MAAPASAPARRRRFGVSSVLIFVGAALVATFYTWLTLTWDYSDGERAGLLQKFSNKGWICKTHEGELALYVVAGVQPEIWEFSVRDPAVARQLSAAVGHRVQLHYTQHRGVPTRCFGDTGYFVDRINSIGDTPTVLAPAG
jgi:hypothetical protein